MKTPAKDNISVTPVLKESMEQLAKIKIAIRNYHANSSDYSYIFNDVDEIDSHLNIVASHLSNLIGIEVLSSYYYKENMVNGNTFAEK